MTARNGSPGLLGPCALIRCRGPLVHAVRSALRARAVPGAPGCASTSGSGATRCRSALDELLGLYSCAPSCSVREVRSCSTSCSRPTRRARPAASARPLLVRAVRSGPARRAARPCSARPACAAPFARCALDELPGLLASSALLGARLLGPTRPARRAARPREVRSCSACSVPLHSCSTSCPAPRLARSTLGCSAARLLGCSAARLLGPRLLGEQLGLLGVRSAARSARSTVCSCTTRLSEAQ